MTVCTQNIKVAVLTLYKTEDTDLFYDLYLRHPSTQRKRPANALLTAEPYCSIYGALMIPTHTYTEDYDDAKGVWECTGYSIDQLKEITKDVPTDKLVLVSLIAEPGVYWTSGAFFDGVSMGDNGYPVIKFHTPPRRWTGSRWEVIE